MKNGAYPGKPRCLLYYKRADMFPSLTWVSTSKLGQGSHIKSDREKLDGKEPPLCPQSPFPVLLSQQNSQHSILVTSKHRRWTAHLAHKDPGRLWLSRHLEDKESCRRLTTPDLPHAHIAPCQGSLLNPGAEIPLSCSVGEDHVNLLQGKDNTVIRKAVAG